MNVLKLTDKMDCLPGVGEKRLQQFLKLGIKTIEDLVYYSPRDYVDYSSISKINALQPGRVTIKARSSNNARTWQRGHRHVTEITFIDDSGQVKAVWFNQPYRAEQLKQSGEYVVSGELKFGYGGYKLVQPSVEKIESERLSTGIIVARYPETKGLNSRSIRMAQKNALQLLGDFKIYPDNVEIENNLVSIKEALQWLHFPKNSKQNHLARERLAFDEMLALQLASRLTRQYLSLKRSPRVSFIKEVADAYIDSLSFELTPAQKKAAWDILENVDSEQPMNRLLEGDVGSGKTAVAAMAMTMTAANGFQTILLCPTTVLAEQHFQTLRNFLPKVVGSPALLTRHTKASAKRKLLSDLQSEKQKIIVGTHALLAEKINIPKLGLLVIDEQHRFGVEDREKLMGKDVASPHVLTMTATPIPRSLALTVYGDLDVSVIDQLPEGRQPIETKVLSRSAKAVAYKALAEELNAGYQAFVIVPKIYDSQNGTPSLESLNKELPSLLDNKYKWAALHGRMKADEKDAIMADFVNQRIDFIVSTTVVEVGVDNPKASIMIVEGAESFGLAQLHQLRGRVGRGKRASKCFLITTNATAPRRMLAMSQTNDGFKLAALDLRLRGPGALFGTKQHGLLEFSHINFEDASLIKKSTLSAEKLITLGYSSKKYPILDRRIKKYRKVNYLN